MPREAALNESVDQAFRKLGPFTHSRTYINVGVKIQSAEANKVISATIFDK